MKSPPSGAPPLASHSAGRSAQTPDTCQKTPAWRQQQARSRPELRDAQKASENSQNASPVQSFNADQLSTAAATANTQQQNQPRPGETAEHVLKHSQALPRVLIGESTEGCSHLSRYLKVKGLDREPIIGLGFVWECRLMSECRGPIRKPFFLCESCRETLSLSDICQHMISNAHQLNFIMKEHPDFLYFWPENYLLQYPDKYLPECMKWELIEGIAQRLSKRERCNNMDAQGILLGLELYEHVRTAPFSKALEIVQNIKRERKLTVFCQPVCAPQRKDQQPVDQPSREESHSTEKKPARALQMDPRSGARRKTEKHHLADTAGDLDGVKQRRVLSALSVTSVSSKADSVVSPSSGAATRLSPQEQPEPRPPVSQHPRPVSELQEKPAEVLSESLSSSIVGPKTTQSPSVSPIDQCLPTRKRPGAESYETLAASCAKNPKLEDLLPAKHACSELLPIIQPSPESASESTCANPAATSTRLSPKDKDTRPGSDQQDFPSVDWTKYAHLMALVREMKSALHPRTSAPDNSEKTTLCANYSSECVERRWDPTSVQTTSNMAPSVNSLKETFSTAAPVVLGREYQLVSPNYPQQQKIIDAQSTFVDTSQSNTSAIESEVTKCNPGQIPEPRDNPGQIPEPRDNTDCTGVRHLPINTIVTVRPNHPEQQFMGSYNKPDYTGVNRGNQVTHSLSKTESPSEASGAYVQYSQMDYVTRGLSGYFTSEAVRSYTMPDNPPVHTGSSYQCERYTTGGPSQIYPQQEAARFSLQSFGHSSAPPSFLEWVRLGMQQQQLLQQQYSSWTSASQAAGQCNATNAATYVPFTTPANNSQKSINLNDHTANGIPPTQNSGNITQNIPQVYYNPPVPSYPPPMFNATPP